MADSSKLTHPLLSAIAHSRKSTKHFLLGVTTSGIYSAVFSLNEYAVYLEFTRYLLLSHLLN